MRAAGMLSHAKGFGLYDHACWGYRSREERDEVALQWLSDAAALGQKHVIVTQDDDRGEALRQKLVDLTLVDDGIVATLDQLYDLSRPIDVESQPFVYAGLLDRARAAGYTGLRVFCDITTLITESWRQESHALWEHSADSWIAAGHEVAPICAYDLERVKPAPGAIAALHPLRYVPDCEIGFGLFAGAGGPILEGEVDTFTAPVLSEALRAVTANTVDVSRLRFLDGAAAACLFEAGSNRIGTRLTFIGASEHFRRVWHILDFDPAMLAER